MFNPVAGAAVQANQNPNAVPVDHLAPLLPQDAAIAHGNAPLPVDTPIGKFSALLRLLKNDRGEYLRGDEREHEINAAVEDIFTHLDGSAHKKLLWRVVQTLRNTSDDPPADWERTLSAALRGEAADELPMFQPPGSSADGPGSSATGAAAHAGAGTSETPRLKKLAELRDTLLGLSPSSKDPMKILRLLEILREAIAHLPPSFLHSDIPLTMLGAHSGMTPIRLFEVNGGHVVQTREDYGNRVRTKLFFPADPTTPFATGPLKSQETVQLYTFKWAVANELDAMITNGAGHAGS